MFHLLATGARSDPPTEPATEAEEENEENEVVHDTKNEEEEQCIVSALKEIEEGVKRLWEGLWTKKCEMLKYVYTFNH